jgi:hypothetical protein
MNSINLYRSNAEDCLRLASAESNESDRPLWVTLAQSWLMLAEHADRLSGDVVSVVPPQVPDFGDAEEEAADY